jgi:hypothetical protein
LGEKRETKQGTKTKARKQRLARMSENKRRINENENELFLAATPDYALYGGLFSVEMVLALKKAYKQHCILLGRLFLLKGA